MLFTFGEILFVERREMLVIDRDDVSLLRNGKCQLRFVVVFQHAQFNCRGDIKSKFSQLFREMPRQVFVEVEFRRRHALIVPSANVHNYFLRARGQSLPYGRGSMQVR